MALTAFSRFRMLWGAFDWSNDPETPAYDQSNSVDNYTNAVFGRKLVAEWERSGQGLDVAQTHIAIVNTTGGNVDTSWTQDDFAFCEAAFLAFWGAIKDRFPTTTVLSALRWYRVGPGATPPEPAVRSSLVSVPGTSSGPCLPAQCAENITLRTGLRKAWGRMYLPAFTSTHLTQGGTIPSADVDGVADAASAFVQALAAGDFIAMVYSGTHQRMYAVERVKVDNIFDTQRRRRHRSPSYSKQWPT
jgi:hypothetical protein